MSHHVLFILAVASGFYMAWNIGANDVANAMGTSLGSGALRLRQAALIAGVMNFLGAVLVGAHVTNTVRKGVIDPRYFTGRPREFLIGMVAVLLASGIWVTFATWREWPVSTTHSVIGAITGFGLTAGGIALIQWKIIGFIVLSWILSPVAGALISYLAFYAIRKTFLNHADPLARVRRFGPIFTGVIVFFLGLAMLFKGLKNLHLNLGLGGASAVSLGAAILAGLATARYLKKYVPVKKSPYDEIEELAKPLQIFSASYESFANGANDVANAIGPVAAILAILDTGTVQFTSAVPVWLLAVGGIGIWVGISTWGWRVMGTIGKKITYITPTRGFSAEFGTATTVLICSQLGMPVSTTHTSVGNVIGVGLARGLSGINLKVVWKIIEGWLWTLPAAGVLASLFYLALSAVLR